MGLFHPFKFLRPTGRAGPSRCGAQCKTWARGLSEQWFYDVIAFSQPCYDRGRAQIYRAALTRELSTFANVRDESCSFWRERSLLTMKFIWRFYRILKRKLYLAKWIIYPNAVARGPMQLHRLHRLKVGPVSSYRARARLLESIARNKIKLR